jgi:glycosyltransferase involved in cell wall biosynthesis
MFSICCELDRLGLQNIIIHSTPDTETHKNNAKKSYSVPFLDDFSMRRRGALKREIQSIINKEKPDLIYLHNIHNPYVVDMLTGAVPVIKFLHDHELYCPKKTRILNGNLCINSNNLICLINAFRGDGYRCMERRKLSIIARKTMLMVLTKYVHKKVHTFVVASEHIKNNLVSSGYAKSRIEVIPYFIRVPPKAQRERENNTILFVGRLLPDKGLEILLDILTLLKEGFRCVIVGQGIASYESMLRAKIKDGGLGRRVKLVGWCDNKDLGKYYSDASLFALPSMWPEPFGIVGIEAMAHALPVVAFNVGGIADWLQDKKTGFLIERGNKNSFAQKIDLLLADRSLQTRLGQNAYERAIQYYDKAGHMEKLLAVFNKAALREK